MQCLKKHRHCIAPISNAAGFTIVELMVVVAVMAVLSAIAIPVYQKYQARSRQAEPVKLISLLRGDLDWIVIRALEKDRSRRYETANGLALEIQRFLGNEPVLARPPSRPTSSPSPMAGAVLCPATCAASHQCRAPTVRSSRTAFCRSAIRKAIRPGCKYRCAYPHPRRSSPLARDSCRLACR